MLLLLLTCALALVAMAPASASAASSLGCADTSVGTEDRDWTADILADTNAHRTAMGLPALALDPSLTKAATWKARDLARRNYFAHDDQPPAGSGEAARSPWDRLIDCGYDQPYSTRAENIAAGQQSGSAFVTAWLNSAGHRANIENASMRYIGIATAYSAGSTYKTYSVQIFSSEAGALTVPTPPVAPPPAAPTTTTLALSTGSPATNLCPPAPTNGIAWREDRASGPITVTATATGCLRITPSGTAGTGVVVYRAWSAAGVQSAPTTLTVTVTAPRVLDGQDPTTIDPGATQPPTTTTPNPPRTVVRGAAATIVRSRCTGRWSVAGWCYVLVTRGSLVRANGRGIAAQLVHVTRRTVAGRSALLGTVRTSASGGAVLRTRLKPPRAGTHGWLLRNVRSVQLQFRGSALQLPSSAVVTTRLP